MARAYSSEFFNDVVLGGLKCLSEAIGHDGVMNTRLSEGSKENVEVDYGNIHH